MSGCSSMLTSKMPSGSVSMEQTYNDAIQGRDNPTDGSSDSITQLRTQIQANNNDVMNTEKIALQSQFRQLSNPNIVMYVYPHLVGAGNNSVPVPGYYTVFPMYTRVYYTGNMKN